MLFLCAALCAQILLLLLLLLLLVLAGGGGGSVGESAHENRHLIRSI